MNLKIDYLYNGKLLEDYYKTQLNDNIKIHYSLFLEDGKKIETPYDKTDFYFKELGYSNDFEDIDEENNGTIIKGLDKVITELTLGDLIRVKIPYEYNKQLYEIIKNLLKYTDPKYMIPEKTDFIYYLQLIFIKRNDNVFEYSNIFNLNEIIKTDNINEIKEKIII